jgi:hypothetical protein
MENILYLRKNQGFYPELRRDSSQSSRSIKYWYVIVGFVRYKQLYTHRTTKLFPIPNVQPKYIGMKSSNSIQF